VTAWRRNLVRRPDGVLVNVARPRGQILVCATGCCCGRAEDGFAPVPGELFHGEWERRRLRNLVHLTIGGCLGPCALANVVVLLFDGQALWFQSMNSEALVLALYDYVDEMLDADRVVPAPAGLAPYQFTASAWQPRPDGQPVDDYRPRRRPAGEARSRAGRATAASGSPLPDAPSACATPAERLSANLTGPAAVPRRNGELVFEAPWQGRIFGMAVALSEQGVFAWEEFRQALIAEVAAADQRGGGDYYQAWLAAFERVLAAHDLVDPAETTETTYQFEYGERDDVF
jgi:nitrile hydratase accessory protein